MNDMDRPQRFQFQMIAAIKKMTTGASATNHQHPGITGSDRGQQEDDDQVKTRIVVFFTITTTIAATGSGKIKSTDISVRVRSSRPVI